MSLQLGKHYSRREIHGLVGGGDLQSYLPYSNGRILCGCFDTKLNRRAPCEIDVGDAPKVLDCAKLLARDRNEIPVFLKRKTNGWEFVGRFRATGYSEDPADLTSHKTRRSDAVAVLYLEECPADDEAGLIDAHVDANRLQAAEGRAALVRHLRRERSRQLVEAKKRVVVAEHGALSCEACGLTSNDLPDTVATACFEVHHLQPLSSRKSSGPTRLRDLALLCANCHRMIHGTEPLATLKIFRELLGPTSNHALEPSAAERRQS